MRARDRGHTSIRGSQFVNVTCHHRPRHSSIVSGGSMNNRLNAPYWALRIGLGLGAFLAGLDKFFNILADWQMYLSPMATKVGPGSAPLFMRCVGVIEMIVGLIVLAGARGVGGYTLWGFGGGAAVKL